MFRNPWPEGGFKLLAQTLTMVFVLAAVNKLAWMGMTYMAAAGLKYAACKFLGYCAVAA